MLIYDVKGGEVADFEEVPFRICTPEDFEGIEDSYEGLRMGVDNAMYCPEDIKKMKLRNSFSNMTDYIAMNMQFNTCNQGKVDKYNITCNNNETEQQEFYNTIFFDF